ncbi:MAG: hypothetical protein ACYC0H_13635 [Solirubrobacteraceae bacterium]
MIESTMTMRPSETDAAEEERALRRAQKLMRPEHLAALPPSRLSASRSLVNKMLRERWTIELARFEIDERGHGEALYRIDANGMPLEFMVFSFEPDLRGRTGRIIGTNWDMMGSLVEGTTTAADFRHTLAEFPKLYAGRATPGTLIWCRSNRSMRAFDAVVESLAATEQPDIDVLASIGYLMRNTGLDGNGTFGTRSFLALEPDHPLRVPYHAQMLAAYMMREFSFDLVEHMARQRNPGAARLTPDIRRFLGIGNGSALGLVFFVNNHPVLVDRWLSVREQALAHARRLTLSRKSAELGRLLDLLDRAARYYAEDRFSYQAFADPHDIAADLRAVSADLNEHFGATGPGGEIAVGQFCDELESRIGVDAFETFNVLLIELVADVADGLVDKLTASEVLARRPEMPVSELIELLEREYRWALEMDMSSPSARAYVWYKSSDAEEPRRGPVDEVTRTSFDWDLDLPTHVQRLHSKLSRVAPELSVGEFLASDPGERAWVQRIQGLAGRHLHSPHMNMLADAFVPSQIVRLVNSVFHGIDKTLDGFGHYQQTNRGVVGLIFHGAPTREDLRSGTIDWIYPREPRT